MHAVINQVKHLLEVRHAQQLISAKETIKFILHKHTQTKIEDRKKTVMQSISTPTGLQLHRTLEIRVCTARLVSDVGVSILHEAIFCEAKNYKLKQVIGYSHITVTIS